MGNAVPGGEEITGVLALLMSLALQDTRKTSVAAAQKNKNSDLFVDFGVFTLFLGERFTGDSILTFNPPAEINKLTPLRTEGTKRIVFPLDQLTAGWAFHESGATGTAGISKRCRTFDQYSSFDECDRTFAAHGIQAYGDTFSGGADD